MNATIRARELSNGISRLYLDIIVNNVRKKERLELRIYSDPKTQSEKLHNKNQMAVAENLRVKRLYELEHLGQKLQTEKRNMLFLQYLKQYVEGYKKKDKRVYEAVELKFVEFAELKKLQYVQAKDLTARQCELFGEYLRSHEDLHYSTPSNYFKKFRSVIRTGNKDGITRVNIDEMKVKFSYDKTAIRKAILTQEEIMKLYKAESPQPIITRAFTFCLNTGLDYATVSRLTWKEIDGDYLRFDRTKTVRWNNNALNEIAMESLGERGDEDELIFPLPSWTQCVKSINVWAKRAKIKKHITWHSARHSLGSILINDDNVNIRAVQEVLGHTNITTTMRYTQIKSAVKDTALRNLKIGKKTN